MSLFGWAAALNPVAMLGNALSFGTDWLLQDAQNRANKEQTKDAQRFSVDMWNLQNQYNTPSAQVQRLRDAGLNPNLAYGQVADSKAALVGAPSPAHMGRVESPRLFDYQQVVNMQEQNKLIRSQRAEVEQRAIGSALENQYKKYENEKLMDSGMIKADTPWMKNITRGLRSGFDWLLEPADKTFDRLRAEKERKERR